MWLSKMAAFRVGCAFVFVCVIFLISSLCSEVNASTVKATEGEVWPAPLSVKSTEVLLTVDDSFQFVTSGQTCDILNAAYSRYYKHIIQYERSSDSKLRFRPYRVDALLSLNVNLLQACEQYPSLEMDESYSLVIGSSVSQLKSKSIWGILRGLETFSQLIYHSSSGQRLINSTVIDDSPRFAHRGILLDTSRHFIPKHIILQNLEAMAQNKFNVFHWHIVDDPSFPYESRVYPDLSRKGAYQPLTHVYTQEDIQEIIEYARVRGIRVVAEFDTPGHTQSMGNGQPGLLTKCYSAGKFNGNYGPIDPSKNSTYTFLTNLMKEIFKVFPDKYVHLGGDEVSFSCWQSNPDVIKFVQSKGWGKDFSKLEQYYMQNLLDIIASFKGGDGYIIWQEVIDNGVKVKPDTVVEVWKGGYQNEMAKVTKLGLRAILSSCWYLNYISYGNDWPTYYKCDPQDFTGDASQKKLVIGGEACMWGEYVDGTNLISRLWPRASAVAERLWSPKSYTDPNAAASRLEEHRCRMLSRGLNVEPINGPGYCKQEVRQRK